MADRAYPDQNNIHSLIAVSNADGVTPVSLWANPTTHSLTTSAGGTLVTANFDYVAATYPDGVTEVYTYKSGGSGGTTVATVTVIYSDSTKATLTSVTKV